MEYLCLVYGEEKALDALSKGDMEVLVDESLAYDDVLRRSGHYLESAALQHVETAKTVRVRNRETSSTDGPFAETKEQPLGFILDARDLDDAVQVAAKIPTAFMGSVEVRPLLDLEPLRTRRRGLTAGKSPRSQPCCRKDATPLVLRVVIGRSDRPPKRAGHGGRHGR